jgi:hypothetical protein
MTEIATKIRIGAAACAIGAVAAFTPASTAQADTAVPIPTTGLGSSICNPVGSLDCSPFASNALGISASPGSILQSDFLWVGGHIPNPPADRVTFFTFQPLALLPGFLRPFFGWFEAINFEVCVGGLSVKIGLYGSVSGSIASSC